MITVSDGEKTHQLPDTEGKLTLVCKSANMSLNTLSYSDGNIPAVELTFEVATYHADRVSTLHSRTMDEVKKVFPEFKWPLPRPWPDGVRNIVGLIDMTHKLIDVGTPAPIVWKYPEAFLHPAECANLADVLIKIREYSSPNKNETDIQIPGE
jgi:hypothetical protein